MKKLVKSGWFLSIFLLITLIFCGFATGLFNKFDLLKSKEISFKKYSFSEDYFTSRIPVWGKYLGYLKGKPDLNYLEIGVFEGRSALWMLENILTASTSKMTGMDIFSGELEETFRNNLKASGFLEKVTVIKGYSQIELRRLPLESYDIIYIDGSHIPSDVLTDAVLSWGLLKKNGILIFDDYQWENPPQIPRIAIDAFLDVFKNELSIIYRGFQIILKKTK